MHGLRLSVWLGLLVELSLSKFSSNTPVSVISVDSSRGVWAVGDTDGILYLYKPATQSLLQAIPIGDGAMTEIKWNSVSGDSIALVTSENKVVMRKFDNAALASSKIVILEHLFGVRVCDWDPSMGTKLLVGSMMGYVYQYSIAFPASAGTVYLSPDTDRSGRWFAGCEVSFLYYVSTTLFVSGCTNGKLTFFSTLQQTPMHTYQLPHSTTYPSPTPLYRAAKGTIIALFDHKVFQLHATSANLITSFSFRAVFGPKSPELVPILSFDVSFDVTNDVDKLAIRTADGVAVFDFAGIAAGSTPTQRWVRGQTLPDLFALGAQVAWSVTTRSYPANTPVVNTEVSYMDVEPCYPEDCSPASPATIAVDVILPFTFSKIGGAFTFASVGGTKATDCTAQKAPIVDWTSSQQNQWVHVLPTSPTVVDSCVSLTSDWVLDSTLADCKSACFNSPECNMVSARFAVVEDSTAVNEDRIVETCALARCDDPSRPQTPADPSTEIWTLTTSNRPPVAGRMKPLMSTGGYVAFGTEDQVIHGGCAATNGVVSADTTVSVPDTLVSEQSVLRFQISQYSADAVVRLKNLSIDLFLPFPDTARYYAEPSGRPGGFSVASPGALGGPRAPLVISGSKIVTIMQDSSVDTFDL